MGVFVSELSRVAIKVTAGSLRHLTAEHKQTKTYGNKYYAIIKSYPISMPKFDFSLEA